MLYVLLFFSINILLRCDGKIDCEDYSDESNCHKIKLHEGYMKSTVPPPYVDSNLGKFLRMNYVRDMMIRY